MALIENKLFIVNDMEVLRSILHSDNTYAHILFQLSRSSPHVLVIEGDTHQKRLLISFAYALLLSCIHSTPPCYVCDACLSLSPYMNVYKEYIALEKKQKQEHGTYVIIGNTSYLNGKEGIYIKQISLLKKQLGDQPRFKKHIVIIEDFHAIHSIKEVTNALLKTMEESSNTIFILTVPERNTLMHTILSRAFILTLPFRTSLSPLTENTWIDALVAFLTEGTGWFSKSMSKEECSPQDIKDLLLACNTALCEYLYGRQHSALARIFAQYTPSVSVCTQIIQEAEQAFLAHTNPLLIADTLAIRLYTIIHAS